MPDNSTSVNECDCTLFSLVDVEKAHPTFLIFPWICVILILLSLPGASYVAYKILTLLRHIRDEVLKKGYSYHVHHSV